MDEVSGVDIVKDAQKYGFERFEARAEHFEDVLSAFNAINNHNKRGGLFIRVVCPTINGFACNGAVFDFWTDATIQELRILWEDTSRRLHVICETIQPVNIFDSPGLPCVVCSDVMSGVGHSAYPLDEDIGRCCDKCFDERVKPAQAARAKKRKLVFQAPAVWVTSQIVEEVSALPQQQEVTETAESASPSKRSVLATMR